jgi:hypothetical protein
MRKARAMHGIAAFPEQLVPIMIWVQTAQQYRH